MPTELLLSPHSATPMYAQIVEQVVAKVMTGEWKAGDALPSIRELAGNSQVSVITVKRAYEELEREGIIFRRQGLGTFVAEQGHSRSRETKLATAKELLRDGFREAAEAGLKPTEILELARELLKERK